jgi:hypothetical protein
VASSVEYSGWGGGAWGQTAWGTDLLVVSVDGVAGTTALGSVAVVADANVSTSGLAATSAVGSVTVNANSNVAVSGLSATSALGSVTATVRCRCRTFWAECYGRYWYR